MLSHLVREVSGEVQGIAHRFAHRVPFTKLVELDGDICPYLSTLMVAILVWVGEALVMPEGMRS